MLAKHLGEGDEVNEQAWRAAVRIFEHSFGRPVEVVEEHDLRDLDPMRVSEWNASERAVLRARILEDHPHLAELVPARLRDGYDGDALPLTSV